MTERNFFSCVGYQIWKQSGDSEITLEQFEAAKKNAEETGLDGVMLTIQDWEKLENEPNR